MPLRLLIVEDNPGDADLLREALSDKNVAIDHVERIADAISGHSMDIVGQAKRPQESIDGILSAWPDVIVLDVQFEGGTGLEVLRAVRSKAPTAGDISQQAALEEHESPGS